MIAAVSGFSSAGGAGSLRWVERCWATTRQARRWQISNASCHGRWPADAVKGSVLSLDNLLQDQRIERKIRHRLPEPLVLLLEILQSPSLADLQPTVLASPAIVTLLRNPQRSADLPDLLSVREPNFGLTQYPDNLFRRVSLPCHSSAPFKP